MESHLNKRNTIARKDELKDLMKNRKTDKGISFNKFVKEILFEKSLFGGDPTFK